MRVSTMLAVVGLDLSARAYPGWQPLREAGHAGVLLGFRSCLHRAVRFAAEVPLPIQGDLRAWDAVISGPDWRYGVEVEMHPNDAQALQRRLALEVRDGDVDGVLLVVPDTRHVRAFTRAAGAVLGPSFPVDGRRALELLRVGADPGGRAIIVL